jgi:hypothetical protein
MCLCFPMFSILVNGWSNYILKIFEKLLYFYCYRQWKKYIDGRKTHDRTRWLNSPNVYQKVEILETGTPDPKKITKVEMITFENKTESK